MTTMNNEDPADPSVHEPRGRDWPEPVAWMYVEDPFGANEHHWMLDSPESQGCDPREWTPLYTADQMRAAIAAERERSHELLQAADHIRAGLEAKLAALSAALAEKEQPK